MRQRMSWVVCLAFCGGLAACQGQDSSSTSEPQDAMSTALKSLEGKWVGESSESDGEIDGRQIQMLHFDIKGDDFEQQDMASGSKSTGKLKVNPNQEPKTMDLIFDKETLKTIYKVAGDKLTICYALKVGMNRPTSFTGAAGTKQRLRVYTRFIAKEGK